MAITVADILTVIRDRNRGDPPSAIADIFVNPLVKTLGFVDAKEDFSRIIQSVDSIVATLRNTDTIESIATDLNETVEVITAKLSASLDDIASNYGITRRQATASNGTVLLLRSTALPATTTVPLGKRVTAQSINQDYRTTQTITITPSNMVFDAALGFFTFPASVESINVGSVTVVGAGQINRIKDGISNITGVTNTQAVVGGRDIESDEELAERIKVILGSSNIGTKEGYRNEVLSITNVRDAAVVGAGDPLMARDSGDGGSVDIYVAEVLPLTVTETITTSNLSGAIFTPTRQPIVDDIGVISVTGFSPFLPNTIITKDNSLFSGSIKALDTIRFRDSGGSDMTGIPTDGSATVTFQTNSLVSEVQIFMDDPSRKILGADLLIKEAVVALVDVVMRVVIFSGFSTSTVKANVENAIVSHIASLGIGKPLEESDVIDIVSDVDGVDRVDLPLTKFDRQDGLADPVQLATGVISAEGNEVLRPGIIVANI